MDAAALDSIVSRLRGMPRDTRSMVKLPEQEILSLCFSSRDAFLSKGALLHVDAPTVVCGDIHGQFIDLLRHFDTCGFPPEQRYVFLGDYVDRGIHSLETICLLLALRLRYPDHVYLLRGNHECASVNRVYGFYDECKRRHSLKIWKAFTDCFNAMPIMAVIANRILCVHGGLSPDLASLDDAAAIARPCDPPPGGLVGDLLWSDPDMSIVGWGENDRGVGVAFGPDVVHTFLARTGLQLICRAHQVVEDGYEFFAQRKLVTIFSAPNYCGEFDNAGAVLRVDADCVCSFAILKPVKGKPPQASQR